MELSNMCEKMDIWERLREWGLKQGRKWHTRPKKTELDHLSPVNHYYPQARRPEGSFDSARRSWSGGSELQDTVTHAVFVLDKSSDPYHAWISQYISCCKGHLDPIREYEVMKIGGLHLPTWDPG